MKLTCLHFDVMPYEMCCSFHKITVVIDQLAKYKDDLFTQVTDDTQMICKSGAVSKIMGMQMPYDLEAFSNFFNSLITFVYRIRYSVHFTNRYFCQLSLRSYNQHAPVLIRVV